MIIRAPFVSAGTGKGEEQGELHKFRYAVSLPTLGLLQQWTVVGAYGARAQRSGAIITVLHPLLQLSYEWSTSLAA